MMETKISSMNINRKKFKAKFLSKSSFKGKEEKTLETFGENLIIQVLT